MRTTTRRMAYFGFIVATYLAVRGLEKGVDLVGLCALCTAFLLPIGAHAIRKVKDECIDK